MISSSCTVLLVLSYRSVLHFEMCILLLCNDSQIGVQTLDDSQVIGHCLPATYYLLIGYFIPVDWFEDILAVLTGLTVADSCRSNQILTLTQHKKYFFFIQLIYMTICNKKSPRLTEMTEMLFLYSNFFSS